MRRAKWMTGFASSTMLAIGCVGQPLIDNPVLIPVDPSAKCSNPVMLSMTPTDYAALFETTLSVLDDYFEIERADRYAGLIVTRPKIAPGYEQFWKSGSPDSNERLLATFQTMRYRGEVNIRAEQTGYGLQVVVLKELEDLPRPLRQIAGDSSFRNDPSVDRYNEIVTPNVIDVRWIPKGRETSLEQVILQRVTARLNDRAKAGPG